MPLAKESLKEKEKEEEDIIEEAVIEKEAPKIVEEEIREEAEVPKTESEPVQTTPTSPVKESVTPTSPPVSSQPAPFVSEVASPTPSLAVGPAPIVKKPDILSYFISHFNLFVSLIFLFDFYVLVEAPAASTFFKPNLGMGGSKKTDWKAKLSTAS